MKTLAPKNTSKKILLVGGFPKEVRRLEGEIRPYGLTIGWHWNSRSDMQRGLPPCDGVIVMALACSHDLSSNVRALAASAKVPYVVFTTRSRSMKHLKQAGLLDEAPPREAPVNAKTHPLPPAPTPASPPSAIPLINEPDPETDRVLVAIEKAWSKEDRIDEVIIEAHDAWTQLAQQQATITQFLVASDTNRGLLIPDAVAATLKVFRGRSFIAFVLHATRETNIRLESAKALYYRLHARDLGSYPEVVHRAKILGGPELGFFSRKPPSVKDAWQRSTTRIDPPVPTPSPAPVTEATDSPTPPLETPMAATPPAPTSTPSPSISLVRATPPAMVERFHRLLMAAIESGEKITVEKTATGYALTYADGVTLTLSSAA